MPSRYRFGIEQFSRQRPNLPIFNDIESILDQLEKYWLLRERFKRGGHKGIRRKPWWPAPPHFKPSDEGEQGPLV